jgi:hypothetical protein
MRWLGALVLLGACGGKDPPVQAGNVSLVLDIPNGMLDPVGFTTAEIVLHAPTGDVTVAAKIASGAFDLGRIDPSTSVSIEATLRNDSGAAVGYGRTGTTAALTGGAEIVVPVRRPIAYIAGTVSRDPGTRILDWTEAPATFSDLSVGGTPDGKTQLGSDVVHMVGAGPNLYAITQATSKPNGALTGPARLAPVSMADHQVGAMLAGTMTGGVLDSAGSDDGSTLVIGTTTQLYAVSTATGMVRVLADGSFARVAIVMTDSGELDAIAVKNRGATGACPATAELWWAPLADGATAHKVATGGFADLASDRGRAFYVDSCKAELGELTSTATQPLRAFTGANVGRPTALAVSNGQAYVGFESQPATTSLLVAAIATAEPPRTLWTETAQQVLQAHRLPEVQRLMSVDPTVPVVIEQLQVGAGGDYVALTTRAHFHGQEIMQVRFPDTTIDAEELRVFDAATGGTVQRYRSWCDGLTLYVDPEIPDWDCALTAGQTAPSDPRYEHHINSMTFLFGKK